MSISLQVLYSNNTQLITLYGLQEASVDSTGTTSYTYVNDATVTASLLHPDGSTDSTINNLAFTYVTSSNGIYQATVPSTFSASSASGYTLEVKAISGGSSLDLKIDAAVMDRQK